MDERRLFKIGHNKTPDDAEAAVNRYRLLTGDRSATLVRNGNHYSIRSHRPSAKRLNYYGAGPFCQVVDAFCDGFEKGGDVRPDET